MEKTADCGFSGFPFSPSGKTCGFATVSATASVGAVASQRCPPDTRTLVRGRQGLCARGWHDDVPRSGRWADAFGRFVNRPYAKTGNYFAHNRLCGIIDILKSYVSQLSRKGLSCRGNSRIARMAKSQIFDTQPFFVIKSVRAENLVGHGALDVPGSGAVAVRSVRFHRKVSARGSLCRIDFVPRR